ncbi:FAD-dependent thymidylate synthase [Desulfocurvibacter africanus]|uniref:FAD-dependent thymidylate synthase n=1 Tax=Desulfocurvibacter africanus subsp. africanus str. Walvis Bay TaxID=690850 RepID=F3YV51_DESAF|nr:FAD-dependent thymidylate synthase [Desulfocurvibacter africanus]EGJ48369.1 thymidylate synthase, flavin-dependent [Desulfocurvibacter africanus subsp. africanus str. Walvis Bay]
MRIIKPSYEILNLPSRETLRILELAGRTCYKSEDKMTPETAEPFIARIVASGHESVIEHASATVRFVCDRGVTHEMVRHRLASYSQESTRYANYAKDRFGSEITVIRPCFWREGSTEYAAWLSAMEAAEQAYLGLIQAGAKPQEARSVLPNSLKTEIVMSANMREWRHVFRLRCDTPAHPQIREVMLPLLGEFHERLPVLFADLFERFQDDIVKYRTILAS